MEVLTPHLSVALTLEEFTQGIGREFSIKYIVQPNGRIMKRTELGDNRFFQYAVESLPNKGGVKLPELKDEIAFLPAGKVPIRLFNQIVDFFQRVMKDMGGSAVKTHGALEAMAHVVWNPSSPHEYQVRIPTQKVSAAAVTYERDHLLPGDVIVVDIHSHNTMGAFFSGTDNNDDQTNTCYSGVVGKLDTATPATIWRFNDLKHKIPCELADIFQSDAVKCPDEWLKKVTRSHSTFSWDSWSRGRGNRDPLAASGRGNLANLSGRKTKNITNEVSIGNEHLGFGSFGVNDDLFDGMRFGVGEELIDDLQNEALEELEQLEKAGIDLGFSKVEAGIISSPSNTKMLSDEDILTSKILSEEVSFETFAEVLPRFYLTKHNGVDLWVDKYSEDPITGEFEYLTDKEKEECVEEEGEFMMYVPSLNLYISSYEIEKDSTPEELWDIFVNADNDIEDDIFDDDEDVGITRLSRDSAKSDLMQFLKTGTSTLDKLLITAYLYMLHEKGELKPIKETKGERNVQLH